MPRPQSRLAEPSRRQGGRSFPWTSCRNLSPRPCATSGAGTTLFPPGHFDMVWASPVCTEYSRALTMRPRRLEEGDALLLRAFEIMEHFDPLMWVIENPATGLLKTRPFMERLPWVTYCKYGTPYRKQTRLWTNMRWRPSRGLCRSGSRCDAWEGGRHLRGAQGGPRLTYGAVRGDCARGHGRACGSAEHPGLKRGAFLICHFFLVATWHSATARRLRLRTLGRTCS